MSERSSAPILFGALTGALAALSWALVRVLT